METPKRTAGTGTRYLGSAGTPEYINMEAGKTNPMRTVQCRESETEREREREREGERERERGVYFLSNVSMVEQRVLLICHYFFHIVKINYILVNYILLNYIITFARY